MGFICDACKRQDHGHCRGGTWCDCHCHPPGGLLEPADEWVEAFNAFWARHLRRHR